MLGDASRFLFYLLSWFFKSVADGSSQATMKQRSPWLRRRVRSFRAWMTVGGALFVSETEPVQDFVLRNGRGKICLSSKSWVRNCCCTEYMFDPCRWEASILHQLASVHMLLDFKWCRCSSRRSHWWVGHSWAMLGNYGQLSWHSCVLAMDLWFWRLHGASCFEK